MSYKVLARKWRPQTFADVISQEHVLTALANGLSLGRIHHAYLLSGTRGVGKTTIARLLAKGLNCETGITATPCGQCNNCYDIEQGIFVDLIEIDAASRTKVEDTRELLDNVQYAASRGRFKIYLIDEIHMLSRHSFNALLKTLEEPPVHVKFLLATTDPQKLPVTILSRCLQFHLKALNIEQISYQLSMILQKEHIAAEPRALQLLASAADGSMRDALSLTDQAIAMGQGVVVSTKTVNLMLGTLNTDQPLSLIEALVAADGSAMMAQLDQYAISGMDWERLIIDMLALLHRLAMSQLLLPDQFNDEDNPDCVTRLRYLTRHLPPADLQLYYQILLIGRKELHYAPNPRMGVEMTLLRALTFHPAAVEAEIIPISTEKKTAEFTAATDCQLSCMSLALKPPVVTPNVTTGLVSNMSANNYTEEPVLSADKNRMQAAQQPTMSDANGEEAKQERQQQDKLLISQHSILQDMTAQLLQVQAAARPAKKINKDEPTIYSSLEWRPLIYQEKLMRAREAIMTDAHIPMLRRFFDAELDNDSIRPV